MKIDVALSLLIALLREAQELSTVVARAKAEGREDLTDDEVAAFAGRDDAARTRLQAKIEALPQG